MIKEQSEIVKLIRKQRTMGTRCRIAGITCMTIAIIGLAGCNKVEDKVLEKEFNQAVEEIQEDSMNVNYTPQNIAPVIQNLLNEKTGLEVPIYQIYYANSVAIVQTEINGEPKMFKITVPVNTDSKEWAVVEYELCL